MKKRFAEDEAASPHWFDPGVVRKIVRKPVVNVNLGDELILAESWTLRSGLFTDFSSAPDVDHGDDPQLTKVHRFGGSLSVGFQNDGYDLTLGVTGSCGRGKTSVYRPVNTRDMDEPEWQPATYEERAIYVFIAGMQKTLAKTAKVLWKKATQKKSEEPEPELESGSDDVVFVEKESPAAKKPLNMEESEAVE